MEANEMEATTDAQKKASDSKGCLFSIVVICIVIFSFNFIYLYNLAIGPTNIAKVDLASPGLIRYVEGSGHIRKIGSGETKTLKLEIQGYFLLEDGDKRILIRHDPDFQASGVSGRLEKLSKDEQEAFGMIPNLAPRKINAYVSYAWGTNLFMFIAMPAFPVALLLLLIRLIKGAPKTSP